MSNPHQSYHDAGAAAGRARQDMYQAYTAFHGSEAIVCAEWTAFAQGVQSVLAEVALEKRVEYKVEELLTKLRALCIEYDASISFGCGCCGAGLMVKDLEVGDTI